jgi:hypothetical protein
MTKAPEIQMKLQEELLSVDAETLSMDELMALPYLDAVVRETLRVHPPVPNSVRIAMKDDVLPIEKPYTDKNGVVHKSIRYTSVSRCEPNEYPFPLTQHQQRRPDHYPHTGDQPITGVVGT